MPAQFISSLQNGADLAGNSFMVEVGVGDGHKQAVHDHAVQFVRELVSRNARLHHIGCTLNGIDQQILELCQAGVLPAHPADGTAHTSRCFLALKTKHVHTQLLLASWGLLSE